jgi:hypothetical protein
MSFPVFFDLPECGRGMNQFLSRGSIKLEWQAKTAVRAQSTAFLSVAILCVCVTWGVPQKTYKPSVGEGRT